MDGRLDPLQDRFRLESMRHLDANMHADRGRLTAHAHMPEPHTCRTSDSNLHRRHVDVWARALEGAPRAPAGGGVAAGPPAAGVGRNNAPCLASPAEVARVVLFLADPESTWLSGSVVDCNGASYLH